MTASSQRQDDPRTPVAPAAESTPASAEREAYAKASAVALTVGSGLPTLPRSSTVVGDLIGFYVRLNFGTNDPAGVMDFAALVGVEVETSSAGHHGTWLQACGIVEGVSVRAEVLLSDEATAVFVSGTAQPHPEPDGKAVDTGTMALAEVPAAAGGTL